MSAAGPEELANVVRRVQKLLAIANDHRADPNEAAAAASMAEKVMRKYQIDHATALSASLNAGLAEMSCAEVSANMKRDDPQRTVLQKVPRWAGWLAYRVAKLNDAETRLTTARMSGGAQVQFFGFAADVQVAAHTFDYLVGVLIAAMRSFQRSGPVRTKAESESYRTGFVLAVCAKLQELRYEKDAEMQAAVTSRALVISKAGAIAAHFGAAEYKTVKRVAPTRAAHAFLAGRAAGAAVDVGRRGIGNDSAASLKLN